MYNLTFLRHRDAAELVKTIFGAVAYLHKSGIVHRDLKPENLLFKDPNEDADIMICDFGLSRVMESDKMSLLTEICGTPGVSLISSTAAGPFLLTRTNRSTWRPRSSTSVSDKNIRAVSRRRQTLG